MAKLPMTALCANLKPTVRFKQRDQLLYLHRAYSVLRSNPCRIRNAQQRLVPSKQPLTPGVTEELGLYCQHYREHFIIIPFLDSEESVDKNFQPPPEVT